MDYSIQPGYLRGSKKLSQKGLDRVTKILEAASQQLVQKGMEDFSVNKVAARAGISLGNLQYYFPHKKNLLSALLQSQFRSVEERLRQAAESGADSDKQLLRDIIDYAIELNFRDDTCAAVWNTITMALYDKDMQDLAQEWYSNYWEVLAQIVQRYEPSLTSAQARSLSLTIMSTIEGNALVWRHTVPGPRQRRAAKSAIISDIELLITSRAANPNS